MVRELSCLINQWWLGVCLSVHMHHFHHNSHQRRNSLEDNEWRCENGGCNVKIKVNLTFYSEKSIFRHRFNFPEEVVWKIKGMEVWNRKLYCHNKDESNCLFWRVRFCTSVQFPSTSLSMSSDWNGTCRLTHALILFFIYIYLFNFFTWDGWIFMCECTSIAHTSTQK